MEPWYGETAAIVHQLDEAVHVQMLRYQLAEARTANGELLVILGPAPSMEPIGLVDYRLNEPGKSWLTIGVIAVGAEHRGRGYGAEAVRLVEVRTSADRFLANINPRNGLSLYFWLRQGYRPARQDEIFWRAPDQGGIISMIRIPNPGASNGASDGRRTEVLRRSP
jgi:RimJ/RimL family protein N-acetyltransferase